MNQRAEKSGATGSGAKRSALARWARPLVIVAGALSLGGCAAPVIGAITISQLSTAAGVASSIMSGRDLGEHVVSAIVGEDCRFLEAILRGRPICVPYGSPEADDSFQGIIVALNRSSDDDDIDRSGEYQVAGLDPTAIQLGFAPIVPDYDVTTGAIAAVERDIHDSDRGDMRRVSFGMMSATYGASHSMDDLLAEQRGRNARPFLESSDAGRVPAPAPASAPRVIMASATAPAMEMPVPLAARRHDGKVITPDLPQRQTRIEQILARAQMAPIPD